MKRFALWMVTALSLALAPAAFAASYQEGVQYDRVKPAQPTATGKKIEVVELFWYGCPHCYEFEPSVKRWEKSLGSDVEFVRMPATFRPEWELHARAFYTAQMLGVLDKLHPATFTAIHELRERLNTEEALQAHFGKNGVSAEDFKRAFRSFAVESKVRRAKDMTQRYGTDGVPALIVNGKYWTGPQKAGGYAEMLKIADQLIEQERKAR